MLFVIKSDLFAPRNVSCRKEAEPGQVGVEAVDPDVEDGQVGFARVVDEVSHVAEQGRVHCVRVVVS